MIVKNKNTFHLTGKNTSYIMALNEYGDLLHYYFGKKLLNRDYSAKIKNDDRTLMCCDENGFFLGTALQEYPAYGYTDLRNPAYIAKNNLGDSVSKLCYKSYCIKENETAYIEGMPSVFRGNLTPSTLEITLCDEITGLRIILSYTVFEEYDIILRSTKFINDSQNDIDIDSAYSASVDFAKHDYDLIYFPGAWSREREFVRVPIKQGEKIDISNASGGSGHAMNPFVILCDKNTTERSSDAYGFSLIYSGNHSSFCECDQFGNVRIMQGINPFGFSHSLKPGETFFTPQTVICYSSNGFGGISRQLHDIYRDNLCKSSWAQKDRPILINNWEGTYFDFDEKKLLNIAKLGKDAGMELFVLDDGWFGIRNDDKTSLGDWIANKKKLPSGIKGLTEKVNALGISFGLWFEPEMVSPDSDLYRSHPDWIIRTPHRNPALGRNQYMLDLTKSDVCDYIIKTLSTIIRDSGISYIKWDYNRIMTDMPCKGYNHKYTLGLYKILDSLLTEFPELLIEGCSGGGGRFDAGMLAYSPQIWTSDNSDSVARLKIQYSTSICYPLSSISAHVTASPNHQLGRFTPLKTRADVAYTGAFGYELDITKMPQSEIDEIKSQIKLYKDIRTLVRTGDFYRLQNPYESNYCGWQIVAKDGCEFILFTCRILSVANYKEESIMLEGLDETSVYVDVETGEEFGGDELMYAGVMPEYPYGDFSTIFKRFRKIDNN